MDELLASLASDWSPLAVLAKLMWVIQLAMIVHVLKTGRPYWWFWILISAPVIGGIAYALIEVAPDLGGSTDSLGWKPRSWRIRDLREELEDTDTVKLRLALASELLAGGGNRGGCENVEKGLTRGWGDEPHNLAPGGRGPARAGGRGAR